MPDGVRLSARLWIPETGPTPAIVEYIPYRKRDMVRARDERNHNWFAQHGYACIRIDMRGSGDSEGLMPDMYAQNELDDALTALEWIKNQSWCNGAIGMMGTSWGATSALQAATSGSGLLKAVIAVCATNNRFDDDIHHMGGCLLTDTVEWGATLPAILALPPAAESDPQGWRDNWRQRLEHIEFPLLSWVQHETRDAYWTHGSVNQSAGQLDCPVLAIGGWSDRYSNSVMNLLADNPQDCWGIVGPWGHHYPDQGVPGPAIGFQQQALRWWDFWLRGKDNGADKDPRLQVWCSQYQPPDDFFAFRQGHWRAFEYWPINQQYYDVNLVHQTDSQDTGFIDIPFDLRVGTMAADTGYFGRPGGLPLDQSADDKNSLVFQSDVLEGEQLLLGKAEVVLDLKLTQQPSQIIIRLCDVAADGKVARVAYRVQNLALDDDGLPIDDAAATSVIYRQFALPNAAYTFAPGHRIRIALSASYWPQILPTSHKARTSVDSDSVKLKLALAPDKSTVLSLSTFEESITSVNRDPASIQERIQRSTELSGNLLIHRWHQPLALTHHDQMNIDIGAETSAQHSIDLTNPATAESRFEHRLMANHDGQKFETRGSARLSLTEGHYQVEGALLVKEDDIDVFSRQWSQKISREFG